LGWDVKKEVIDGKEEESKEKSNKEEKEISDSEGDIRPLLGIERV